MVPPRPNSVGRFGKALEVFLLFIGAVSFTELRGQFTYTEDFKNNTAPGWDTNFFNDQNIGPGIRLTSGATPNANDPEFGGPQIDPTGAGWMRMTTILKNQVTTQAGSRWRCKAQRKAAGEFF